MLAATVCQNMGITAMVMEGDALQVINNLSKTTTDWSEGGLLIEDAIKTFSIPLLHGLLTM